MKLLVTKFSSLPCYLVLLRPKYSPQHYSQTTSKSPMSINVCLKSPAYITEVEENSALESGLPVTRQQNRQHDQLLRLNGYSEVFRYRPVL
jgi:hypothetical protein